MAARIFDFKVPYWEEWFGFLDARRNEQRSHLREKSSRVIGTRELLIARLAPAAGDGACRRARDLQAAGECRGEGGPVLDRRAAPSHPRSLSALGVSTQGEHRLVRTCGPVAGSREQQETQPAGAAPGLLDRAPKRGDLLAFLLFGPAPPSSAASFSRSALPPRSPARRCLMTSGIGRSPS
jgi:hypothetical protein